MQKNRAAASGNPWARVVVELDDQIVEMIIPPQSIAGFTGRAAERPVVAAIAGILGPGEIGRDAPDRQQGARPRRAIRPPPQPYQPKPTARRGAVALAFVGPNASAPEHGRNGEPAGKDQPAVSGARPPAHANARKSLLPHRITPGILLG